MMSVGGMNSSPASSQTDIWWISEANEAGYTEANSRHFHIKVIQ